MKTVRNLRLAAALAAALLPLASSAQTTPPPNPEPPRPPKPGLRVPKAIPPLPGATLTWFGQAAFALQTPAGATVVVDPFAAAIGLPVPAQKLPADAVVLTHEHLDHTNVEGFVAGTPKVLHGLNPAGDVVPLKETVKGVRISTIPAFHDDQGGKERGKNAIAVFEIGGLRVVHLGDFGQRSLTPEQKKALGKVDILLVPVGGFFTVGPKEAAALVKELAPTRAAIPMHYRLPGLAIEQLGPVDPFLAEFPADRVRREAGPSVTYLPGKDAPGFDVIVLNPLPANP